VRLPDSPQYDALILARVREELGHKVTTDKLDIVNLVEDAPTEARLNETTPENSRARARALHEFLLGTDEAITPRRLGSVLEGHEGQVIVVLGHIGPDGAVVYRGANGRARRLPLAVIKEAEQRSNVSIVVLGCRSGTGMPVGTLHEINSIEAAGALGQIFAAQIRTFNDLFAHLSTPDLQLVIDPVDLALTRGIEVVDRGGSGRGRIYWFSPWSPPNGPTAKTSLRSLAAVGGAGRAAVIGVVGGLGCSLLFGIIWAISIGGGIASVAARMLASVVVHAVVWSFLADLIRARVDGLLADWWAPGWAFALAGVAFAVGVAFARHLSRDDAGNDALRPLAIASTLRLLGIGSLLAVAGIGQFETVLAWFPVISDTMSGLVAISAWAPETGVGFSILWCSGALCLLYVLVSRAASLLGRVGLLSRLGPLQHLAVPEYWMHQALRFTLWLIHPDLVRCPDLVKSRDTHEFRTSGQRRWDYARWFERYLLEAGVRDGQVRHQIVRARLALCDEIYKTEEEEWILVPTRDYGVVVTPDPWLDGHPGRFCILGYRIGHELLPHEIASWPVAKRDAEGNGANRATPTGRGDLDAARDPQSAVAKAQTPELISVTCQRTGIEHFLPRAMTELWRSGVLPSRHIPTILAQLEPRLRRGDFLAEPRAVAKVRMLCSLICLPLVAPFLLDGIVNGRGVAVAFGLLALALVGGCFLRPFLHWRRLARMSRCLARHLAGGGTSSTQYQTTFTPK